MKKKLKKIISLTVILSLTALLCPINPPVVHAAGLTYMKDTLTTLTKDAFADHEVMFVTADGVIDTETIVITMPSDFDGETGDALDFNDVDMFIDATADHICGDGTAQTIVTGASPGVNEWGAVFSGTENRVLTLKSGGGTAVVAATNEVCVEIGENATGGAGNAQYDNTTTSGAKTITLAVGGTDTGSFPVYIVDDDSVAVDGTVAETLTFTITDIDIGFGALVTANARFASADGNGTDGPTPASAHDLEVTTNATTGYSVTYNGATLTTPSSKTIDVADVTDDGDGTPASEEFGISIATDGNATVASGYAYAVSPDYKFVASTTTSIISETVATAIETFSIYYLANIHSTTDAGTYTTAITYICSANF